MAKNNLAQSILSVDLVVFSMVDETLSLLVNRREADPFKDAWALPGVAVQMEETLDQAARRALKEKGGVKPKASRWLHLEQLATFDSLYRDPRGRTVSVAHLGLTLPLPLKKKSGAVWMPVEEAQRSGLPFDHGDILLSALARLRGKIRYTNIASRLLPDTFRIEELQGAYQSILGQKLNRTNFRGKLLKIGLIQRVGHLPDAVGRQGGRQPHLYRFVDEEVEALDRDFL